MNCYDGNPNDIDPASEAGDKFYFYNYNGTSSYMCINENVNGKRSTSNQWTNPEAQDQDGEYGTGAPLCKLPQA